MGIREEFYDSLCQEYEEYAEQSYLYQYFLTHPRSRRGKAGETAPRPADIRRDIQTFLYDVRHGRKKDRSLAMLDDFCARQGITSLLSGGKTQQSGDSPEELEGFCRSLIKSSDRRVRRMLIPLRIDPGTGAGLYLAGADLLEDAELPVEGACCYLGLWLEDLMLYQDADQYLWSIGFKDREELREQYGYPNLGEALTWFERLTSMKGNAYRSFSDLNGPAPPGCPASLRRYFDPGRRSLDRDGIIAQGRESFRREAESKAGVS